MSTQRKLLATLALALLAAGSTLAADHWITDFAAAKAEAKKTGRPILADFTGSDWCGWCMKLDREVFSQKGFQQYAKESLVLFQADFPQQKKLSPKIVKQNERLQAKYQVEGYPTILLLDAEGAVLGQTGYAPGGAEAYVPHLKSLLEKSGWKPAAKAGGTNAAPAAAAAPALGTK